MHKISIKKCPKCGEQMHVTTEKPFTLVRTCPKCKFRQEQVTTTLEQALKFIGTEITS